MTHPVDDDDLIDPDLLLRGYAAGLFPMSEGANDPQLFWVKPELRGIILLDGFHISKSLRKTIRRKVFDIRINHDFPAIIDACAAVSDTRSSTWINKTIRNSYIRLHELGHCHSVEAWQDGVLAGGLYGVSLGRAFFGESMFTRRTDASKVCMAYLVARLKARGFVLLDTQFINEHLKQFGAIEIPRRKYQQMLNDALGGEAVFDDRFSPAAPDDFI